MIPTGRVCVAPDQRSRLPNPVPTHRGQLPRPGPELGRHRLLRLRAVPGQQQMVEVGDHIGPDDERPACRFDGTSDRSMCGFVGVEVREQRTGIQDQRPNPSSGSSTRSATCSPPRNRPPCGFGRSASNACASVRRTTSASDVDVRRASSSIARLSSSGGRAWSSPSHVWDHRRHFRHGAHGWLARNPSIRGAGPGTRWSRRAARRSLHRPRRCRRAARPGRPRCGPARRRTQ